MAHTTRSGATDFDFLHGSWQVLNERLTSRLTGADEWERFDAIGVCEPILHGLGNADRMSTEWRGGFEGFSLRLFDQSTGHWSIYWADSSGARLLPPVVGAFENGLGEFYGRDQEQGRDVLVRFRWQDITPTSARWEQAFSIDEGKTWETNWIMRFASIEPRDNDASEAGWSTLRH
jgi:hypothetical protein